MSKDILVFDVNETLLDLKALDPEFKRVFGDASIRGQWFAQFIQSAFVTIITNSYVPFGQVGKAALEMIADKQNVSLSEEDKKAILSGILTLPPHPEVSANLARLKENDCTLVALTNSTQEVAQTQLKNAGVSHYFDKILSADGVKRLKPAKEAYAYAANESQVPISQIRLIAAHAWDITGALRAGCKAAFIQRPGMVLDPLAPKPDIVGKDLQEVADLILSR